MPTITDKEVKKSIKRNEEKLTLKFNTCLALMTDIEHIVKNATNTWKNVYLLHKMDDFSVTISKKDDDDDDKAENDNEENDEETTQFHNIDYEEGRKKNAAEAKTQDTKENDLIKIATLVIASLPHCPRNFLTTSSMETTFAGFNTRSTTNQSIFAPI